jgi:hypothetical protein
LQRQHQACQQVPLRACTAHRMGSQARAGKGQREFDRESWRGVPCPLGRAVPKATCSC